jgi:hypothetical protein
MTTLTAPAEWTGVVTVIVVPSEETLLTVADVPPKVTVSPELRFVPTIVAVLPPVIGPDDGITEAIAGDVELNDSVMITSPLPELALDEVEAPVSEPR